jgi:hypothetical protein
MNDPQNRRDFLRLASVAGIAFASGLAGCASRTAALASPSPSPSGAKPSLPPVEDFFFLQLSDTHWGFEGPANPEAATTLKTTIETILSVEATPDFVVFTGDITHNTPDGELRRTRMRQALELIAPLRAKVKDVRFLPGEHDASFDAGAAYREHFGESRWSFDHRGIHFVGLDNVSDSAGALGSAQLEWLAKDLAPIPRDAPIVVFAHRPLFDLYPDWDWATKDGAAAIDILAQHAHVTVFYGHIHQEHHHMTGAIAHHAARSLVFPLPAPGSVPKKAPILWDPAAPNRGIGYRAIESAHGKLALREAPVK